MVKGATACNGTAEGVVRVIKNQADLKDFQAGEILVAEKTQPRYVPIMSKAAAIITDIGGITSHAATISREFNIPCIVASENATKLLKNGNHVRMNASTGTVEVL